MLEAVDVYHRPRLAVDHQLRRRGGRDSNGGERHHEHVVLVTSEIHMRRSIATFRTAGIDAVPAIAADPLNFESRIRSFIPTTEGLRFSSYVAHEYVGLVYYWLRGWISLGARG